MNIGARARALDLKEKDIVYESSPATSSTLSEKDSTAMSKVV